MKLRDELKQIRKENPMLMKMFKEIEEGNKKNEKEGTMEKL